MIQIALAAQADADLRLPQALLNRFEATAHALLKFGESWNWKKKVKAKNLNRTADLKITGSASDLRRDAQRALIRGMPCMSGDLKLQLAALDKSLVPGILRRSPKGSPRGLPDSWEAKSAACDFHCFPWLSLELQANLPMVPTVHHTT
eukprot:1328211-Amorphochlora_amoeboformis.AAC.1